MAIPDMHVFTVLSLYSLNTCLKINSFEIFGTHKNKKPIIKVTADFIVLYMVTKEEVGNF
jgi:uncharacterized protein YpbB